MNEEHFAWIDGWQAGTDYGYAVEHYGEDPEKYGLSTNPYPYQEPSTTTEGATMRFVDAPPPGAHMVKPGMSAGQAGVNKTEVARTLRGKKGEWALVYESITHKTMRWWVNKPGFEVMSEVLSDQEDKPTASKKYKVWVRWTGIDEDGVEVPIDPSDERRERPGPKVDQDGNLDYGEEGNPFAVNNPRTGDDYEFEQTDPDDHLPTADPFDPSQQVSSAPQQPGTTPPAPLPPALPGQPRQDQQRTAFQQQWGQNQPPQSME